LASEGGGDLLGVEERGDADDFSELEAGEGRAGQVGGVHEPARGNVVDVRSGVVVELRSNESRDERLQADTLVTDFFMDGSRGVHDKGLGTAVGRTRGCRVEGES